MSAQPETEAAAAMHAARPAKTALAVAALIFWTLLKYRSWFVCGVTRQLQTRFDGSGAKSIVKRRSNAAVAQCLTGRHTIGDAPWRICCDANS
jgi:hypothetical protein